MKNAQVGPAGGLSNRVRTGKPDDWLLIFTK